QASYQSRTVTPSSSNGTASAPSTQRRRVGPLCALNRDVPLRDVVPGEGVRGYFAVKVAARLAGKESIDRRGRGVAPVMSDDQEAVTDGVAERIRDGRHLPD